MTKAEIKVLIKKYPSHFSHKLKKQDLSLYNEIDNKYQHKSFSQKLYDYLYNPTNECIICKAPTNYLGINNGYSKTCGYKCNAAAKHIEATEIRNCVICNSEFETYKKRKKTTCSVKCLKELNTSDEVNKKRNVSMKRTLQEKYGVDHFSKTNKFKNTMINHHRSGRYDYDDITTKLKKTKLEKYGDENYNNTKKTKKTNLDKYGVDNFSKTKMFKEKHYTKVLKRLSDSIEFIDEFNNYNGVAKEKYKFKCTDCNNVFTASLDNGNIPICLECNPIDWNNSTFETEIRDFIKSIYNGNIVSSDRSVITPMELDIYLPNENIAIECNGNYWHSEIHGKKNKQYHLNKTNKCNLKGVRLIHIFEDEWLYKKEIVKARLTHIISNNPIRLYARNTEIREITTKEKGDFLEKTHIQGNDKSSVKLGLFYKNSIVSVMTFSKRKIFNNIGWELSRYSTKCNVVGGASKLLKYFKRTYNPKRIISYSDIRWNTGNLYEKLGFVEVKKTPPGYFYLHQTKRLNRINFQKHKLKDKLKKFNPNLTEWENMQLNGYDRIWDCGNYKYVWDDGDAK